MLMQERLPLRSRIPTAFPPMLLTSPDSYAIQLQQI